MGSLIFLICIILFFLQIKISVSHHSYGLYFDSMVLLYFYFILFFFTSELIFMSIKLIIIN